MIILMKKSVAGPQILSMNNTDFERAAGGRKIKYSFTQLQLNKGRINTEVKHTPMARELAVMLQEDDMVKKLIADQYIEFSMTNDFKLTIKNNTPAPEPASEQDTDEDIETVNPASTVKETILAE